MGIDDEHCLFRPSVRQSIGRAVGPVGVRWSVVGSVLHGRKRPYPPPSAQEAKMTTTYMWYSVYQGHTRRDILGNGTHY